MVELVNEIANVGLTILFVVLAAIVISWIDKKLG